MGEADNNLVKVENFIAENASKKLDLVVLPEFFATGFDYARDCEPENGGKIIEFISELAKKYNTNIIAGTVLRRKSDGLYNTSFALNRKGEVIAEYDKIHLFDYFGGSEGSVTKAGNKVVTVEFDFAKVGMAICFDIRFPLHFNKLIKENVDMIVVPTGWLIPNEIYNDENSLKIARDMWKSMCRTRAYDNMTYFVISNLTQSAISGFSGLGTSMVITPTAEIIAEAHDKECAIFAQIDTDIVKYLKQVFPVAELD